MLTGPVRDALERGARALSSVTAQVTEELPVEERFLQAGRVAHKVAELARAQSEVERAWVPAGDGLVIEDWSLERGGADE